MLSLAVGLFTFSARAQDQQTFNLVPQWNLITFQVTPANPEPAVLFGTLPGFQSAWTYDAPSGAWFRYVKPSGSAAQQANDATANTLLALPPIEPGRAYWVFTSQASAWTVRGALPLGPVFPSLNLVTGWNLFGVPVGATTVSNAEPVSLLAVLTAAGFDYDTLLTWENQTYRKMFRPKGTEEQLATNILAGLPPDQPFPNFDLQRDLGRGYWIRVTEPAVLRPRLLVTVRPDMDAEPTNNFPSKEDINVSGAKSKAEFKSIDAQDVIRFFPGEDVQTVGIANVGDGQGNGGGILIWRADWEPVSDPQTPEPWVRLFTSPAQKERRDEQGRLVEAYTSLQGVTTLENDQIYLRLDRRNLGRGTHEGRLVLRTSVGDKTYRVLADVSGLEGDFKGYAVIQSVNGKRNPIPDIDLALSFYEDQKTTGLLRGVMDSSIALLWPVDVPLVGYRLADEGNQFLLRGSFVLPPGDQNGEPFDRWDQNDSTAGEDVDWLNDGKMDTRNPFPFPIQRTLLMEGALVKANPSEGYVLEGKYTEVVHGMSRYPIELIGTFRLERSAARPFATRRQTANDSGIDPVLVKRSTTPLTIPAGGTREGSVPVLTEMELQSLQVSVGFATPLPHTSLLIKLVAPRSLGVELVLYDGRSPGQAIHPRLLEAVTFPTERPTESDFAAFVRAVQATRTEAGRAWKLVIENTGGAPVTLANWSLRLEGQPVTDVSGVVKSDGLPVPGARVALDGLPFNLVSGLTDAEGRFTLNRVPLLPLNLIAYRPGYLAENRLQPGLADRFLRPFQTLPGADFTSREQQLIARFNPLAGAPVAAAGVPGFQAGTSDLPFELNVAPALAGPPQMVVGPTTAMVGADVEFMAVNPAGSVFWVFGDGIEDSNPVAAHRYAQPGVYVARMFSPADSSTPQAEQMIVVLPAPGHAPPRPADLGGEPTGLNPVTRNAPYTAYVFQPFASAAGAIPAQRVGLDPATGADRYLSQLAPKDTFGPGETNQYGAAFVSLTTLQHAYAASMDIDLAPRAPVGQSASFEADKYEAFPGPEQVLNTNSLGFRVEDFNYALLAADWINTRTLREVVPGGQREPEYEQDAESGLIVWGNSQATPAVNYATQIYQARDGANFSPAVDDSTFHAHRGETQAADQPSHPIIAHYQVACAIGNMILAGPSLGASVQVAKARRADIDDPLAPALVAAPPGVSRNLYFQLHTGSLVEP